MASFLKRGYSLILLGRSKDGKQLETRIAKLLKWFDLRINNEQIEIIEADFLKPLLGLTEVQYKKLCSENLQIVHCASDTSFLDCNRERIFQSNLESLEEIFRFAEDSNAAYFHYISTAYVAGTNIDNSEALTYDLRVTTNNFFNVYEESKASAEKYVFEKCSEISLPFTILRPSIVYGDSSTGRTLRFNALYNHIKSIQFIRDIYLNDILYHSSIKSKKNGIYIDNKGVLKMPLRIQLPAQGKINLIPVDYFTEVAINIIENPDDKTIYHITSNSPVSIETLKDYCEMFLKIDGIEIICSVTEKNIKRNPHEELFDRFIEPYRPYLSDVRSFDRTNTNSVTGNKYPPEFSYDIFKRCMQYAIKVNWGKDILAQ